MTKKVTELPNSKNSWSRRDVLRIASSRSLVFAGMPSLLGRLCYAAPPESDRILVVFQFSGGNDGMSTIVPHGMDAYYKARPRLAIPKKQVLAIDDTIGIVDSAAPFKELFDEGNVKLYRRSVIRIRTAATLCRWTTGTRG